MQSTNQTKKQTHNFFFKQQQHSNRQKGNADLKANLSKRYNKIQQ